MTMELHGCGEFDWFIMILLVLFLEFGLQAFVRFNDPYQVEWIRGSTLAQTVRLHLSNIGVMGLKHGNSLYTRGNKAAYVKNFPNFTTEEALCTALLLF